MKHIKVNIIFVILFCLFLVGCGGESIEGEDVEESESASKVVEAGEELSVQMVNSENDTIGTAVLSEEGNGVRVKLEAAHLPFGTLAIHFHENGSCEGPKFESAGGHFNPDNTSHGLNHPDGPHAGDLPNLEVNEDGTVNYEVINNKVTLVKGKKHSLLGDKGTAIIIHEAADDGKSQPAGDAGARIACGVIKQ